MSSSGGSNDCGERSSHSLGTVELTDVTKRYGETVAVDRLSLRVESGEFLTLLGPSGCGKSTTLRLIGGFERPETGDVRVGGVSMDRKGPHQRPVNTVFQNYALFAHMTVGRNVEFGLEMGSVPREERRRRVESALEMVRLSGIEERAPDQLSGGQQQRVALARALVNRPAVLLLDEPLGALDLKLRREMQTELTSLNKQTGSTFIYVTHDQEEALTMSDRIAIMRHGRILQTGSPVEIYERPRSRFVADFIGQSNFLPGTLDGIQGGVGSVAMDGGGIMLATIPEGIALAPGARVTVSVRPERVRVVTERRKSDARNRLCGRLVELRFGGAHHHIVVELGDERRIAAHVSSSGADSEVPVGGSLVMLAFHVVDSTILAD